MKTSHSRFKLAIAIFPSPFEKRLIFFDYLFQHSNPCIVNIPNPN